MSSTCRQLSESKVLTDGLNAKLLVEQGAHQALQGTHQALVDAHHTLLADVDLRGRAERDQIGQLRHEEAALKEALRDQMCVWQSERDSADRLRREVSHEYGGECKLAELLRGENREAANAHMAVAHQFINGLRTYGGYTTHRQEGVGAAESEAAKAKRGADQARLELESLEILKLRQMSNV